MTSDPSRPAFLPFQAQAELELLQLILNSDRAYPWNPAQVEADAYFADLEQEVAAAGWTDEDLAVQGQVLAAQFEQIWATVSIPQDATRTLTEELLQRFAAQVPQTLLEDIVQRARQVLSSNLSLADKLVTCVQELFPNWGEDDLQVLARPFAYAMRGAETETLDSTVKSVRCAAWTDLSSIEQARLSLAIARYAISQLPSDSER